MQTENKEQAQRVIAIVGRPNVGKSAIFNRLCGRRIAIVHEQSGVTRDRLVAEARWGEERFDCVDTGGITVVDRSAPGDVIEAGITRQVQAAVSDAAAILFVVDTHAGLMPLDEHVATLLHASGRPVWTAANKADNPRQAEQADEFARLGFPVFPVSALHRRGFGPLMDLAVGHLPEAENPTIQNPLKVTVAGRPNAGKSSYINRLLRSERLIVSDVPGTTRDSIDVPFSVGTGEQARHYVFTDTAGLKQVRKIKTSVDRFSLFRAERSIQHADVVVFVVDGSDGANANDRKIAALIEKNGKGCVLLVNKWDLVDGTTQSTYRKTLFEAMPHVQFAPVVFGSALTGYNIKKSVEAVDTVAGNIRRQIPTGLLNRTIRDACAAVSPQQVRGRRLKIYYGTQTRIQPVTIRLFANDARLLTASYRRYLAKTFATVFGLEGAPVRLQVRGKTGTLRLRSGQAQNAERGVRKGRGRTQIAERGVRKGKGRTQNTERGTRNVRKARKAQGGTRRRRKGGGNS